MASNYCWVAVTPWDISRIGLLAVGTTKKAALEALREQCTDEEADLQHVQVTKEYICQEYKPSSKGK